MNRLWNRINRLNIQDSVKRGIFIGLMILISLLIGSLAWLVIGRLVLPEKEWLVCFMGYPALFVGLLGGIVFLFRNCTT